MVQFVLRCSLSWNTATFSVCLNIPITAWCMYFRETILAEIKLNWTIVPLFGILWFEYNSCGAADWNRTRINNSPHCFLSATPSSSTQFVWYGISATRSRVLDSGVTPLYYYTCTMYKKKGTFLLYLLLQSTVRNTRKSEADF